MINKRLVQRRFSKHADTYDRYAHVQKKMARRLAKQVQNVHPKRDNTEQIRILEIGCGTGYLTSFLYGQFPAAEITAVDIAPGMIEKAKERIAKNDRAESENVESENVESERVSNKRVENERGPTEILVPERVVPERVGKTGPEIMFICADIEEMEVSETYDIIISNATFQWLNRPDTTIVRLVQSLTEKGVLIFSTFGQRTFTELHASFEQAKKRLNLPDAERPGQSFYSLDRLLQLCSHTLTQEGLPAAVTGQEEETYEYFPSVRDFLHALKKIGATNSNVQKYNQRPSLLKDFIRTYETCYRMNDQIQVTYHCLYVQITRGT